MEQLSKDEAAKNFARKKLMHTDDCVDYDKDMYQSFLSGCRYADQEKKKEAIAVLNWLSSKESKYAILYGEDTRFCTDNEDVTTEEVYDEFVKQNHKNNDIWNA